MAATTKKQVILSIPVTYDPTKTNPASIASLLDDLITRSNIEHNNRDEHGRFEIDPIVVPEIKKTWLQEVTEFATKYNVRLHDATALSGQVRNRSEVAVHVVNGDPHPVFKDKKVTKSECAAAWQEDLDEIDATLTFTAKHLGFEVHFDSHLPHFSKGKENHIYVPIRS